jgi:hypothetical protein
LQWGRRGLNWLKKLARFCFAFMAIEMDGKILLEVIVGPAAHDFKK